MGATEGTSGTAAHVAESQGWKNKYFKQKKCDFLPSRYFKLLCQGKRKFNKQL